MSRVVREYSLEVGAPARRYLGRVRGAEDESGIWHGWIEFLPMDGGPALQTGRETTQSSYDHLDYWASGLSAPYLEMALERASATDSTSPLPPPPLVDPGYDVSRIRDPRPDAPVVRVEIETLDPTLPVRLIGGSDLFVGRVRRIAGGGVLVYDGMEAPEGRPTRHFFLLQYGSENAAAVVANRLWSDLHGEGATLRIEDVLVTIDNHEINERLKSLLHAGAS